MHPHPLPALRDNYIWTLVGDDGAAIVVDPGEADPVLQAAADGLRPAAILLTHHHADHVGGTAALCQRWPGLEVFAPADARIPAASRRVAEGDGVAVAGCRFRVLEIPGHTSSHVAFVSEDAAQGGPVFCGDTLFSLGCGRMFEGTPPQMLASLNRLAALPGQARVCCGHEYTLANAAFAAVVEPGNAALARRTAQAAAQRARGEPTVPSRLQDERAANPFLRVDAPEVRRSVAARLGREPADRVEVFAELRRWKDGFQA